MNREIKFRAWNDGEMMYDAWPVSSEAYITEGGLEGSVDHLMQYTGLKDKNGKEIYEGDIIQHKQWANPDPYVVEWKELTCDYGDEGVGFNVLRDVENAEVIGNIYENPELLNGYREGGE